RACPARARPRRATARRPGRSPPLAPALPARERGEVELGQRLVDEPALVVLGERLARDLLGRGDRQAGHLRADLLDRPAGLLLDVAARLLHELLAPAPGLGDGLLLA